jgi:ribosomal protein S16
MPPGSVIKVPDSLWQSYLYASLIAGSSLRGCRSLVIAPALRAAPSAGAAQMGRANGLMKRLVVFGNAMDDYMGREGGILKVGLYAPHQGANDIAGRFRQGMTIREPWMTRVYHLNAAMDSVANNAGRYLDEIGYKAPASTKADSLESPKLHMKANLFASSQVWDGLMTAPGWGEVLKLYIQYLGRQGQTPDHNVREVPEALARKVSEVVNGYYASLSPEGRNAMISFFTIGSANMDYRSEVMNGEVMVTIGGASGLVGVIDFVLLAGLCEWPATPEAVDELLPAPGWMTRKMSAFIKVAL